MGETSTRQPQQTARHAIGIMTGTSIDGLDAALIEADGRGLAIRVRLIAHQATSLGELGPKLRSVAAGSPAPAADIASLAWAFGELHEHAVKTLLTARERCVPALICAHGQTVFHAPPVSWQLLNPAPIARAAQCPIVCDLRQCDLSLGGEGAPITPLADWIMFRDLRRTRLVVNLGGFVNITALPAGGGHDTVRGSDLCVCNQLLDAIARAHLGCAFDRDGRSALHGSVQQAMVKPLARLLEQQSADAQRGQSLGDASDIITWCTEQKLSGPDMAASAVHAVAQQIAVAASTAGADEVILAGGGARNDALVRAIRSQCAANVQTTESLGVPVEAREAMAMAVLGLLALDGVSVTLPAVTGRAADVSQRIDGSWLLPRSAMSALSEPLK